MHHFAVVALLGLVVLKAIDVITDMAPGTGRLRSLLTFALGVTVALVLDYSLFSAYAVTVRETWMGTVATGLVIGSLSTAWQAVLGWLSPLYGAGDGTDRRTSGRPRVAA